MFILEAQDIYRFYHTKQEETLAIRGITFKSSVGELVAVTGPSGSGKSTLLACLSGIDEPDGGFVKILGKRITRKASSERAAVRATDIGIMLQSGNLINHLTVCENIKLRLWLAHKHDSKRIKELLSLVELTDREHSYPSQISGGEAARAAFAIAMAVEPKILFADEPTGEVDSVTENKLIELLQHYKGNGGTAIIATHSSRLASCADRVIALYDGRVIDG